MTELKTEAMIHANEVGRGRGGGDGGGGGGGNGREAVRGNSAGELCPESAPDLSPASLASLSRAASLALAASPRPCPGLCPVAAASPRRLCLAASPPRLCLAAFPRRLSPARAPCPACPGLAAPGGGPRPPSTDRSGTDAAEMGTGRSTRG